MNLTKKEFDILAYFMERAGVVIARDRLVTAVWGGGSFVSEVAVNMHIRSIRRKLGKYGKLIETVRGSGYRFAEGEG